jgi:phosphoglycolate phosphatase
MRTADRQLAAQLRCRASVHFDLDGVLLDSNEIKVRCMAHAIAGLGRDVADRFVAEFRRSFGRSRREHFRRLYFEYLGGEPAGFEAFYAIYGRTYAALVAARQEQVTLCDHAHELVAGLAAAGVPLTVVTGSPTAEAEAQLERLGLRRHFELVLGGEQPKRDRLREVLRAVGTPASASVYLGDSRSDLDAADAVGMDFVYVERYSLDSTVPGAAEHCGVPVYVVRDLAGSRAVHLADGSVSPLVELPRRPHVVVNTEIAELRA